MKIDQIMTTEVFTCEPDDTVLAGARVMETHDCGIIPVVEGADSAESVVGVLTDRDIICRVIAPGGDVAEVRIQEVMTPDVINIHYHATFNAARRLMEKHRVRRLLVTGDTGRLVGILSLTDLARAITRAKLGGVFQELSRR